MRFRARMSHWPSLALAVTEGAGDGAHHRCDEDRAFGRSRWRSVGHTDRGRGRIPERAVCAASHRGSSVNKVTAVQVVIQAQRADCAGLLTSHPNMRADVYVLESPGQAWRIGQVGYGAQPEEVIWVDNGWLMLVELRGTPYPAGNQYALWYVSRSGNRWTREYEFIPAQSFGAKPLLTITGNGYQLLSRVTQIVSAVPCRAVRDPELYYRFVEEVEYIYTWQMGQGVQTQENIIMRELQSSAQAGLRFAKCV